MSDIKPQMQEAPRVPNRIHTKKKKKEKLNYTYAYHFQAIEIKVLKVTRKKKTKHYYGTKLRIISNFLENIQARREYLKPSEGESMLTQNFYLVKLSFKSER